MNFFPIQMAVTIRSRTSFGPYEAGTVLITSVYHAERILQAYGQGKRLIGDLRDGNTVYLVDAQQQPIRDTVLVTFRVEISGFREDSTYRFSLAQLRTLLRRRQDMILLTPQGNRIQASQLEEYIRRGGNRLYADLEAIIYAQQQ